MKTKLFFTLLISFIGLGNINGQPPTDLWGKTIGGTLSETAKGVAVDAENNVYTIGDFLSTTISLGSTTLLNSDVSGATWDCFLIKHDSLGNVLWAKSAGKNKDDFASGIVCDKSGNLILVGYFNSDTIKFGATFLVNDSVSTSDLYIVKYDSLGNVLWAKSVGGVMNEKALSVSVDNSDNILMTGMFSSSSILFGSVSLTNIVASGVSDDMFVVKYDALGNVLWAKSHGGVGYEAGKSIISDKANNVLLAGDFSSSTLSFGSTTITNAGLYDDDGFFAKYDSLGNVIWAKRMGGTGGDRIEDIATDSSGNFIITGSFRSPSMTYGSHTFTNAFGGQTDVFLAKCDGLGNIIWGLRAGGTDDDMGKSLATDKGGYIFLTGSSASFSITFGNSTISNAFTGNVPNIFLAKFDPNGYAPWAIGTGMGAPYDYGTDVAIDQSGNTLLTGYYGSPSIAFGFTTINNIGLYDQFLVKMKKSTEVWPGDTNNDKACDNLDLLPLGIMYNQPGALRPVTGNIWQAYASDDFAGIAYPGGPLKKHIDCSGNGFIDGFDTMALQQNFSFTHSFMPDASTERLLDPELSFVSSSTTYTPGSWVDIDIMAGTNTLPVANLYGIAFDILYDASLVQPGSELMIYPASWFAIPGTNAIRISRIDAGSSTVYTAITRKNQTNSDGYGKIATFRFQVKTGISFPATMNISFGRSEANDSIGAPVYFNPQTYSLSFDTSATGILQYDDSDNLNIFPNPNNGHFNVMFTSPEKSNYKLELRNVLGQVVYQETLPDFIGTYSKPISVSNYGKGVYTITLTNDKQDVIKKIIVY